MESKIAFITGVHTGLGHGFAEELLKDGWTVYGCSRGAPEKLASAYPKQFRFAEVDVGNAEAGRSRLQDFLPGSTEPLGLVILNAGILSGIRDMRETPLDTFREAMEINVWANKWILDLLLERNPPPREIIAISSGASVSGQRGWNAYGMSKAALNMLVRLYAAEAPDSHLLALAPGLIDTGMQEYIAGLEQDDRYPIVDRLQKAKGTDQMPGPGEAARSIIDALPKLRKLESGSYADIRKL